MFSKQLPLEEIKEQIFVIDNTKFKALLRSHLLNTMVSRGKTTDDFLMCGVYVTDLLSNLNKKEILSWYAVDYFLESEEKLMCFRVENNKNGNIKSTKILRMWMWNKNK